MKLGLKARWIDARNIYVQESSNFMYAKSTLRFLEGKIILFMTSFLAVHKIDKSAFEIPGRKIPWIEKSVNRFLIKWINLLV